MMSEFCRTVGDSEMVRINARPIGYEARKLDLCDRIVRYDLPKMGVKDVEHFCRREMHVVEVRVINKTVAPVRAMQCLDTIKLRLSVEKEKLRSIQITIVVDFGPTTGRDVDRSQLEWWFLVDASR